eukprot:scaffold23473_cov14-Tisochrysis_lutea.AAC.1
MEAVEALSTPIKKKRLPRYEALCILSTKRRKNDGDQEVTTSTLCLILVMRVGRSLLKSASGAS